MSHDKSGKAQVFEVPVLRSQFLRSKNRHRCMIALVGTLIAGAASAAPANTDVVRDLAGRVGPIIGSALACQDIARPRIQTVVDKFVAVIRETAPNETIRADLTLVLDRSVAEGRAAVAAVISAAALPEARRRDGPIARPPTSSWRTSNARSRRLRRVSPASSGRRRRSQPPRRRRSAPSRRSAGSPTAKSASASLLRSRAPPRSSDGK